MSLQDAIVTMEEAKLSLDDEICACLAACSRLATFSGLFLYVKMKRMNDVDSMI